MSAVGSPDPRVQQLADVTTTFLLDMVVDLDPRLDFGRGPSGRRILFGAAGGSFRGERLRGEILPGGGDWAQFGEDGLMTLDVRLSLRTDDGALILMRYTGRWRNPPEIAAEMADPERRTLIDPTRYYCRTTPLFETGAAAYAWLNDIVCVGTGYLVAGGIAYRVCEVV